MLLLIFIYGLLIGSFLNVCIYRLPRNESIITPPSHCPQCKTPITWYDNIPVLSYILLKGKCRACKKPISPRYALVEIITAVLLLLNFIIFDTGFEFFIYSLLFCGLIIATFVDFRQQIIPDEVTISGIILGLLAGTFYPALQGASSWKSGLFNSISGILAGALSIYAVSVIGKIIFKKKLQAIGEEDAMGFGDVMLMAMIGAFIGWKYVLLVFFVAPFLGSVVGVPMKYKYKVEIIPYGPYLSLATIIVVFWGKNILRYLF